MYAKAAQLMGESERIRAEQNLAIQNQRVQAETDLAIFRNNMEIEAEKRARAWELEKMTLVSQNDFAQQEKERQILQDRELAKQIQEQDELEGGLKAIYESDELDPSQKNSVAFDYYMKKKYRYDVPRLEEDILGQLGISKEALSDMKNNEVAGEEVVEEPEKPGLLRTIGSAIYSGLTKADTGPVNLTKQFPGGIPQVNYGLQLSDNDRQLLNSLDAVSKQEFESILNSKNPDTIKIALDRLRNL